MDNESISISVEFWLNMYSNVAYLTMGGRVLLYANIDRHTCRSEVYATIEFTAAKPMYPDYKLGFSVQPYMALVIYIVRVTCITMTSLVPL